MNAREVLALLRPLASRVLGLVEVGEITLDQEARKFRELQVRADGVTSPSDVPHYEAYGFTSRAGAGGEAVVLNVGGDKSQPIVILVGDRRYRVEVEAGEVCVYNAAGHKITLREDRISVEAPLVEVHTTGGTLTAIDGVLTGQSIDPYTGQPQWTLGNGSAKLRAEV